MNCQISWIDSMGVPTSDTNKPVAVVCFHKPIWKYATANPDNRIIGYSAKVQARYPICQEHLARVTASMLYPVGAWSVEYIL